MITVKLYEYDCTKIDNLGTELENVLIGSKLVDPLDDTNDTMEISVNNQTQKEPFTQLSKYIVIISDGETTITKNYELRYDLVERQGVSNELYKHTLYLGNPAISAQKRSVDNFSMSYKLQDVSIDASSFNSNLIDSANSGTTYLPTNNELTPVINTNAFGEHSETFTETIVFLPYTRIDYETHQQHYFRWLSQEWQLNSDSLVEPVDSSDNMLTRLRNTRASIIYDNSTSGLNDETIASLNTYAEEQGTTIQVIEVDGKDYGDYIEQPPIIDSNGYLNYTVPQLYAYNSNSSYEITSEISTISTEKKTILPTKTTITILNLTTGNTTTKEYITRYGHYTEYYYDESIIANDTSFDVYPIYVRSYTDYSDSKEYIYRLRELNQFRDYATTVNGVGLRGSAVYFNLGGDSYSATESDGYAGSTTTRMHYANVGLAVNNSTRSNESTLEDRLLANNELIQLKVEENCKYTIKTEAYFGENNSDRLVEYLEPNPDEINRSLETYPQSSNPVLSSNQCLREAYYHYNDSNASSADTFEKEYVNGSDIYVVSEFVVLSPTNTTNYILKPSTKPNTYDLFVKAQVCNYPKKVEEGFYSTLTSTILPYVVDDDTKAKMKSVSVIEDIYQDKNLWEIFMQIGKYIHAKPYIKFYQDKYQLCFKQYGISETSSKETTHNSIYSSNDIESYISSLDSYVANMLQRGNEITEILVPRENDGSHVCVTDNAVLKTKYPILEILGLYVRHKDDAYGDFTDITDYVYEHSIYNILPLLRETSTATYTHYTGNSIYYHLNGTQIMGFQYRTPDSSEVQPYAIKQLLYDVGYSSYYSGVGSICVNDFTFKVKYRTSDDVRVKTFKPDLRKFIGSSGTDDFPMQTQYSNQSDRTIDSKKLGENLYGKLIRSGNTSKDRFEYVTSLSEIKEAGELYTIDDNNYYVSKNTWIIYPEQIQCEVEYSKDFNKLSEVIGIDSQPRFYEVAETGSIKRDIVFDYFITLKTGAELAGDTTTDSDYKTFYNMLAYSICQSEFEPMYACTFIKGGVKDKDTESNNFTSTTVLPTLAFNNGHTLTIEWDMEDNYSAGTSYTSVSDEVSAVLSSSSWLYPVLAFISSTVVSTLSDTNYTEASQVQYCDVYGKGDLVDFALFVPSYEFTDTEARLLPSLNTSSGNSYDKQTYQYLQTNSSAIQSQSSYSDLISVDKGYYIDKDNRETLGFNINVHMLTDSDRFIISSLFWEKKLDTNNDMYEDYKLVFLGDEVNKFSKDTIIDVSLLYTSDVYCQVSSKNFGDTTDGDNTYVFGTILPYTHISEEEWDSIKDKVKAIALAFEIEPATSTTYSMKYIWARNVSDLDTTYLDNADDNADYKLSAISYTPKWIKD